MMLILGAILYREPIIKTITANPHPQLNYLIFAIILAGGCLILMSVHKLMYEGQKLAEFVDARRSGMSPSGQQEMALNCDADIAYVLRMVAASSGRTISHQEQIALENELHKAASRLGSRNALPQFLGGLLVGMGLLGTFIGLLATLDDIAILIASFGDLDMKTADPIAVFGLMVKRMEAPMHSMGIAFSASMYGLLGSIIIGFMMVSVKRCMGDIMSTLGSEVAQHIEFALAREGFAYSKSGIRLNLAKRAAEGLPPDDFLPSQFGAPFEASAEAAAAPRNTTVDLPVDMPDAVAPMVAAAMMGAANGDATSAQLQQFAARAMQEGISEEVRVMRRIEERLTESAKLQERSLNAEMDDFRKQRGEFLRSLAENTEAANNFRLEMQRVGRQMGSMLTLMEKANENSVEQMSELKLSLNDSAVETQRLLAALITVANATFESQRDVRK
ncbi:hypothetical protein DIC66_06490 [Rhodoferax lacus]|uniref:MotA/TolQ/ExbB proton channel domain-containing protein n=1 Tax=Rhodoferax lacus TaxID=2184758 RepID=A0A3E1RDS1_9BURK|nr:hypothetical protein DIC66_06490 [Rhodoferax lacus]